MANEPEPIQELATTGTFTGTIVPEGVPSSAVAQAAYRTRITTLILIAIVVLVSSAWGAYQPDKITFVLGFASMVITALFTSMKSEVAAVATAVKVEDVKQVLKETNAATTETLGQIKTTGENNHTLLNSNMHMALADTLAALLENELMAEDLVAAKPTVENKKRLKAASIRAQVARRALEEHDAAQTVVDKGTKIIPKDEKPQ